MSESFSALLDKSLETLDMKQGSIVSGVVLDIDKDWIRIECTNFRLHHNDHIDDISTLIH